MAAKKASAHRWLPGMAAAALLSAAAVAAVASPAVAARHSPAAISATHPPGYQIVSSGLVSAPPGSSSSGAFTTCPAGTVVWGGGVGFSVEPNQSLSVNTSSPNGSSGWEGWVNNTGTTTEQFMADAICADKPAGYKIVSREVADPAGTQAHAMATCPSPDALLGGGALSTADAAAAVLTSAWPSTSAKFAGYLDNGTAFASNLIVDAVCGHKPVGYKIVSDSFTLQPHELVLDGLTCPSGTSALDGGTQVLGHAPAAQISGSIDEGHLGWSVAVDNTGLATEPEHDYVICAA